MGLFLSGVFAVERDASDKNAGVSWRLWDDSEMELLSLSWTELAHYGTRLIVAFALALPIAWEREQATRLLGLRTLPLVAVACCAYILVGIEVTGGDPSAHGRLLSGLVAGVGFIGGGAILKGDEQVTGTATAASILSTGILGAAVAYGSLEIAILVSAITLATLLLLRPIQRRMTDADRPSDEKN